MSQVKGHQAFWSVADVSVVASAGALVLGGSVFDLIGISSLAGSYFVTALAALAGFGVGYAFRGRGGED